MRKLLISIWIGLCCCAHAQQIMLYNWRFQPGDNLSWAKPGMDDSRWQTISLKPAPGAHDGDVGLLNYVDGWQSQGHHVYCGFGWYRIKIPLGQLKSPFALLGPAATDDVYQIYVNGRLLGGIGDFSKAIPVIYAIRPRLYILPDRLPDTLVIAVRTLASRVTIAEDPAAGGMRIAPVFGDKRSLMPIYKAQRDQTFYGYLADAIEPLLFGLLALISAYYYLKHRYAHFYGILIFALLVTAFVRASQVFYYWGEWESLNTYTISKEIILVPMSLIIWTITWSYYFDLKYHIRISIIAITLGLIYGITQFQAYSTADQTLLPGAAQWPRLLLLMLYLVIIIMAVKKQGKNNWFPVLCIGLLMTGLFASELSAIGISGIWFPFGIGVSRTQYAYLLFDLLLLILLPGQSHGAADTKDPAATSSRK